MNFRTNGVRTRQVVGFHDACAAVWADASHIGSVLLRVRLWASNPAYPNSTLTGSADSPINLGPGWANGALNGTQGSHGGEIVYPGANVSAIYSSEDSLRGL